MQAPLDFKTIEPISYKQTVAVVNSFVIGTTDYLNKFSFWCEKKLMEVSRNIERLEITMNILEAKLASIEGGAPPSISATTSVPPSFSADTSASSSTATSTASSTSGAPPPPPPPPPGTKAAPSSAPTQTEQEESPPATPQNDGVLKAKDDPRYEKWFKMLRLGVSIPQIKMQMQFQGLNPDIIDNPDAPAPEGGAPASSAPGSRALSRSTSLASVSQIKEPPPPPAPAQASESSSEEEEEVDKSANLSSVFPSGPPLPVAESSDATPPPPSTSNSEVPPPPTSEKQGESSSESESEEES